MKDQICFAEKRFFEWHKDTVSVTLRQKSGSYGGGSEVLVVEETDGAEGHLFVAVYDARGNGEGNICPTLTGDHENRITDYTAVVVSVNESK